MAKAQIGSDLHKGGTVLVEGLAELNRKLQATGADTQDMPDLMHRLGLIVIGNARPPRMTSVLASSMRAGRGRTKAVVRAGYARRAAYAGVLHYGDPHRGHQPHPFLTDALKRSQTPVISTLSDGINEILRKNNLT